MWYSFTYDISLGFTYNACNHYEAWFNAVSIRNNGRLNVYSIKTRRVMYSEICNIPLRFQNLFSM